MDIVATVSCRFTVSNTAVTKFSSYPLIAGANPPRAALESALYHLFDLCPDISTHVTMSMLSGDSLLLGLYHMQRTQ